ncbi:tRNA (guanosine(18)-2'-O)-methyltransferase [Novipirellula aureliae]|uniref:tRNA (Guanosine(18)-2'-O)-methyltransferase n=1 Tax=Novipirellula aureliae TaxID=2527966 RepID=A0A5C6DIR5_9BACT|nr:RNA methyltransferase [Novipirellula aureliae]TWU36700.1 tRNA (guanosine(18)-2'-O)-methyltransferase [Novipirellula aureliae]
MSSASNPIQILDSLNDPRLAPYCNLRNQPRGNLTGMDGQSTFIAEGRLVVDRLLESDYEIESLLLQAGSQQSLLDGIPNHIPVYSLPGDEIRSLVGFDFHRGVMACGYRKRLSSIEEFSERHVIPKVAVAMLGVTELENVGSILRSAAAFGIHAVLVDQLTADVYSRRVIRVSMATVFQHSFFQFDDVESQLRRLANDASFRIIATALGTDSIPINDFVHRDQPTILMVGNEAQGLSERVKKIATDRLTIPMMPGTDSLNVGVATAIFMHELTRQKS